MSAYSLAGPPSDAGTLVDHSLALLVVADVRSHEPAVSFYFSKGICFVGYLLLVYLTIE